MSRNQSEHSIIIRMHERGFDQGFQFFGNDLLTSTGKQSETNHVHFIV